MSEPATPPAGAAPATPRRRRLGRILAWTGGSLVVLLLGAFLLRNLLVRAALETAVTEVTGFPLEIGSMDFQPFAARVNVNDLRLRNPAGFEDPNCLSIPKFVVDVVGSSLLSDRFHAEEIDLVVEEVVVVRNAAGELNLDRLAALGEDPKGEGEPAPEPGERATVTA